MVRPYDSYHLNGVMPTSTGTQDFTVSGVGGTPIGCVVIAVRSDQISASAPGMSFSWGVSDGTNTHVASHFSRDNVGTSEAFASGTTDLIRIMDPDTGAEEVVGEFDSFITNGVRINFTTVSTTAYRFVVLLLFGSQTQCFAFFSTSSTAGDTVSPGFETDFVLTCTCRNQTGVNNAQSSPWLGIASNSGSDLNSCSVVMSGNAKSTTETRRGKSSTHLGTSYRLNGGGSPDLVGSSTAIQNYTSTSFDCVAVGPASSGPTIIGLAVSLPSGVSFLHDTDEVFESSTGIQTRSGLGFLPGLWYNSHAANSIDNDVSNFGACAMGVCDFRFEQTAIRVTDEHGVATTNTNCGYSERNFHGLSGNADNILEYAEIVDRADGQYDVDVKVVTGVQRHYSILIVEELPFENATNVSLPAMNADIEAQELFDSTIGASLPAAGADIEAEALYDVSIGAGLPSMSASIDAELLLDATINAGLRSMSASLDVEQLLDATIAAGLPSMSASLDAELLLDATINAGLPAIGASLTVEQLLDAAINAGLPAVAAALEAELRLDATIGADFPTMSATLVADREAFAVITAGLPALQAAITAELDTDIDAVINAGLVAMAAEIDAEVVFDAAIGAALPAADAALVGDTFLDATIDAGLASVSADLTAELRLDAVINVGLPAMAVELLDFEPLGCDTSLLGSKATIAALLGSSNRQLDLAGSSNVQDTLLGSSDRVVDLDASSDTMIDLGGSHC